MAGKIVSIEIGQQITKICEVDYKKKNPHVYHCVSFETPQDAIEDGYLCDKDALAAAIKGQMEMAGIENEKVVFTVASTKIANREVVIPDVKENRIRDIVLANAGDYFPINIEEYNISYVVLERMQQEENKQLRLLVLAAPGDIIKGYYELADQMKLTVMAIDYIGNSSYQILRYQGGEGISLIVQMNDQNTIINLIEKNSLLLQRILPYGSNMAVQAVMEHPDLEAEDVWQAIWLLEEEGIVNRQFEDSYDTYEAKEEVTNSFKLMISNINRVIDYATTKLPGIKIERIQLAGDGSYIQNLEALIENETGIVTQKAHQFVNVSFVKAAAAEAGRQSYYTCCIGAAIAPTDFAPKELVKKEAAADSLRFPLMMLGLCAIGSIVIFLSSIIMYRQAKHEKTDLEEKILSIADIEKIYSDYEESKENYTILEGVHGQTINKSEKLTELFAELEQKTPKGCVLNAIQYGEGALTLQVTAKTKTLCAKYIQNLKTIELLNEVTTSGYTEEDSSQKDGPVTFTVVCTFK